MTNIIEFIREIKVGDTVEHQTTRGTFYYQILAVSEDENRPINYKVTFKPNEEEL